MAPKAQATAAAAAGPSRELDEAAAIKAAAKIAADSDGEAEKTDETEDDDDEEENDEEDVCLLTDEQQAQTLQFFGLSTLDPTTWEPTTVGTLGGRGSEATAAGGSTTGAGGADVAELVDLLSIHPTGWRAPEAPQRTTDPTAEAFDPEEYLVKYYGDVSLAELERGRRQLQAKVEQRTESLRLLVRNNLDRFMKSKDTIDHIRSERVAAGDWGSDGRAPGILDRACTVLPGAAGAEAAGRRGRQRRAADGPARLGPDHRQPLEVATANAPA